MFISPVISSPASAKFPEANVALYTMNKGSEAAVPEVAVRPVELERIGGADRCFATPAARRKGAPGPPPGTTCRGVQSFANAIEEFRRSQALASPARSECRFHTLG